MATRSPTELILKNAGPSRRPVDLAAVTWESRATFGPYLRGLRETARLSLRAASQDLGVSFSYLSKLETGERPTPPSLKVLGRMAHVYGRDLRELMHEAGFRFETSPETDALEESLDARFLRLVNNPALRPMRMDAVVVELIPPLVKRQWIEFARKLAIQLVGTSDAVDALLARPPDEQAAGQAGAGHAPPKGTKPGTKGSPR